VGYPVPILVLISLSVLVRDRETDVRQTDIQTASSVDAPHIRGGGIIISNDQVGLLLK